MAAAFDKDTTDTVASKNYVDTAGTLAKNAAAAAAAEAAKNEASRAALARLTGGQTLSAEDRKILNLGPVPAATETVTSTVPNVPVTPPAGKTVKNVTYRGSGLERIMVTEYTDGTLTEAPAPVTALPGATGGNALAPERVLAQDTFANTFALAFGADEASKPYVAQLYNLTSSFYKTGSSIDESINLAVRKARVDNAIPEFTARFKGLFALDDMLKAGKLVKVPTVAEYIASEVQVADLLTNAGMADIATPEVIGDVLGKGKSVAEVGRILTGVFATIDNAPEPFKKVLSEKYPTVTRSGLAMALIGGTAGSAVLEKEVKNIGIIAAAKQQGVALTAEQAANIATLGYDYQGSLSGLATVAQNQTISKTLRDRSRQGSSHCYPR
jgi:hypothetical protein